ncbi:uncharacterized protein cfap92 isoform X1 [Anguilla anguilla]|uniref:uncharacterized protein cfap92 isoform X1 n=1 Tax=Anguilla anguilla TaxID=7936 RepID=UPI0015B1348A|nr:uncharacterized protein cfap92 isoform X1 [Anguilla anguilla]
MSIQMETEVYPETDKSNKDCSQICCSSINNENVPEGEAGADLTASPSNLDIEKSSSVVDNTVLSNAEFCQSSPSHEVIFTVSIVLGIHKGGEEDPGNNTENSKKKEKKILSTGVIEAPKSQGYYHIEYSLFPDDPEPTKVDLVLFGLAAKVYMENDTKVLKLWQEGGKMWLGWTQPVKVQVTRDLLLKLTSHMVTFRVWDTKDRVSAKAKSDRPKAFRLPRGKPQEDPDRSGGPPDCEAAKSGGIKVMVQKLRALCQKETPNATSSPRMHRNSTSADCENSSELKSVTVKPKQATLEATVSERASSSSVVNRGGSAASAGEHVHSNRPLSHEEERDSILPAWKSLTLKAIQDLSKVPTRLTPAQETYDPVQSSKALRPRSTTALCPEKPSSIKHQPQFLPKRKTAKKATQESVAFGENVKKNGVASVQLSLLHLLAGGKTVTDCLAPCFPGACRIEGICSISIDRQLMSEALRLELNPLVIRILSASSLPAAPVPYHVLKEKCLPVYCQYKFHTMNIHRTGGQEHGAHVYFRDVNVILTGLLSPGELRECLGGPPLTIEVHDRDRKNTEDPSCGPALFGAEPGNDQLSSKRATLQEKSTPRNPCGIAKLDLSDLLHGQRCMKLSVPINCSPPLNSEGQESDRWNADGPTEPPMPMGLYHDFNSVLKVWVEIACPLTQLSSSADGPSEDCPFGRIVYMFTCRNGTALTRLRSEILRINAAAFQLDSFSEETIKTALSCHEMSTEDQESKDLDVVTGFHMHDRHKHLFILEGLRDKAIKRLWETIPIRLSDSEEERVEVLYNSALSFSNRLYGTLDLSLCPVHLHKQLEVIMRQPEVYLRDTVPPACLQALSRISLLLHVKKLRNVVQSNLFPTAEMILSLNWEFGVVAGKGKTKATQVEGIDEAEAEVSPQHTVAKKLAPLDNYNIKYMEWKQQMVNQQLHGKMKDFIQVNIEEVHQASLSIRQRLKPGSLPVPNMETHSCSTQISNCIEQAQEPLGKEKERTWRFCCSQEYQQALAEAVEAEANWKASEARSRAAWRTHDGFRFPGFKSSVKSNEHPRQPDEARVEELRKPWRENVLHGNTLRPTLTRDTWPWISRSQDFERYRKSAQFFGSVPPVTIHLAGESLRQEQLQHYRTVREGSPGNGPVPEFKCHVGVAQGSLGKLEDLLKDKPVKYSLRKPGMVLKPIPMVAVLEHPEVPGPEDEEREVSPAFAPGALTHHSLSWDSNAIPRHDPLYNKFHFTGYWRPHSFHYKRAAAPLTEEERSACLSQQPDPPPETPARGAQRQPVGNIMETRTYSHIYLHVV